WNGVGSTLSDVVSDDPRLAGRAMGNIALTIATAVATAGGSAAAESEIPTIGGRLPINSKYAGGVHPSRVEITEQGFPNFGPHSVAEVELDGLTGNYAKDA